MSAPLLPDFHHSLRLGQGNLDAAELAECHGVLCGLVCQQPDSTANDYLSQLAALQLLTDPGVALQDVLADVFQSTVLQLADEDMGFKLWLPPDEEPLEERTIALAQWCTGFLAGLGSSGDYQTLSEESGEALEDLRQIAEAGLSAESGDDEAREEDEVAFTEIVEYVRVVTLMMREDFRGPDAEDRIH
jgi:uncharacterized protein YgfB (UPF0149 family)